MQQVSAINLAALPAGAVRPACPLPGGLEFQEIRVGLDVAARVYAADVDGASAAV